MVAKNWWVTKKRSHALWEHEALCDSGWASSSSQCLWPCNRVRPHSGRHIERHASAGKIITKNTFSTKMGLEQLILYQLQTNLFTKQIPSHVTLQTGTNQWQQHYKCSGGVILVIVTKIITKINVPRNYFVILSARMVHGCNCSKTSCSHFEASPTGHWESCKLTLCKLGALFGDRYEGTTRGPHDGNGWRKYPCRTLRAPLASPLCWARSIQFCAFWGSDLPQEWQNSVFHKLFSQGKPHNSGWDPVQLTEFRLLCGIHLHWTGPCKNLQHCKDLSGAGLWQYTHFNLKRRKQPWRSIKSHFRLGLQKMSPKQHNMRSEVTLGNHYFQSQAPYWPILDVLCVHVYVCVCVFSYFSSPAPLPSPANFPLPNPSFLGPKTTTFRGVGFGVAFRGSWQTENKKFP